MHFTSNLFTGMLPLSRIYFYSITNGIRSHNCLDTPCDSVPVCNARRPKDHDRFVPPFSTRYGGVADGGRQMVGRKKRML